MNFINEAFKKLFPGKNPEKLSPHQKTAAMLQVFNISVLGEQLALAFLCEVANYVRFPNAETTARFSRKAAGIISEILEVDLDRIGPVELEIIQNSIWEGASVEEIKSRWRALRN